MALGSCKQKTIKLTNNTTQSKLFFCTITNAYQYITNKEVHPDLDIKSTDGSYKRIQY